MGMGKEFGGGYQLMDGSGWIPVRIGLVVVFLLRLIRAFLTNFVGKQLVKMFVYWCVGEKGECDES